MGLKSEQVISEKERERFLSLRASGRVIDDPGSLRRSMETLGIARSESDREGMES